MDKFHFFASSVADWIVTSDTRELPDIIEFMDKSGYAYTLWMVPGDWETNYRIEHYAPQVEGAQILGHFQPPHKRRIERKVKQKLKERDKLMDATI
jgi:hypothetical protein